jgi:hypothetical protein
MHEFDEELEILLEGRVILGNESRALLRRHTLFGVA